MTLLGGHSRSWSVVLWLLLLSGLMAAGCGRRSKASKVHRIEGADAAWNATRMMPGRALYKSQPVWELEARPGDVLGMRILDAEEKSGFGLAAQLQEYADLYYSLPERSATVLEFSRRGPLIQLGETVVGADLNSEDAQTWFAKSSREERRSLRYLYLEEAFPSFRDLLMEVDNPHLILRIGKGFAIESLEGIRLYGLVRSDDERPDPMSSPFFDMGPLGRMTSLRFLLLDASVDVSQLSGLDRLTTLRLIDDARTRHLEVLKDLHSLEAVELKSDREGPSLDLTPLASLPRLSSLWMMGPATGLEKIRQDLIMISFPSNSTDEEFRACLQRNPGIESVVLVACDSLTDLTPLGNLGRLRSLLVSELNPECDLTAIGSLHSLNFLTVVGTEGTEHLAAFGALTNLRRLFVDKADLEEEEGVALTAALPNCDVVGYCMGSFWIVIVLAVSFAAGSCLRRHAAVRSH